jgi:hypothetical protein
MSVRGLAEIRKQSGLVTRFNCHMCIYHEVMEIYVTMDMQKSITKNYTVLQENNRNIVEF